MSSHFVRMLCSGFRHACYLWKIVCVRSSNFSGDTPFSVTLSACELRLQLRPLIQCPIPPSGLVTEIDEDSAFTEVPDSLRVLCSLHAHFSAALTLRVHFAHSYACYTHAWLKSVCSAHVVISLSSHLLLSHVAPVLALVFVAVP